MLSGPRNIHWVIADEVLGLATDHKPINIHRFAANHRKSGEATRGVEGQSAITGKEAGVAMISLVCDPYILPLCV